MRQVTLGSTGLTASCLGFGCASLGARIQARDGVQALSAAYEAGVTWFDLAPAYGRGQAETIAGPFLRAHRDELRICTKAGLAPPSSASGIASALMPLARRAVGAFPPLRTALRRSSAQHLARLPLTPELVRGSLDESLRRLGTDHVDLYALHDARPEDIARDEIVRALQDVVSSGKARAIAVASNADAARRALARGAPFGAVQMALPEPGPAADGGQARAVLAQAEAADMGVITHSVFGIGTTFDRLYRRMAEDSRAREAVMEAAGTDDPEAALARLLLWRAFTLNTSGVVLVSMFSHRSRIQNLAAAAARPTPAAHEVLERLGERPPPAAPGGKSGLIGV